MTATVVNLRHGDRDAAEIGKLCERAKGSMSESIKYLIEAGDRLNRKKESLPRGEWSPWLKANEGILGFKIWTAQRLMKLASDKNVVNHAFTEAEASQISKNVWGNTRPKRKVKPRKAEAHKAEIVERYGRGESSKKISDELGIDSDRAVRHEIERAQLKDKLLDELQVDPVTLASSAKAKLEAAKRMMERQLNADYAARVRAVDEEVRLRVIAENKDYLAMVKAMEAKALEEEKLWREMINRHKPPFSPDEFKLILMCLHPDGERTPEKLNQAFLLFNDKKTQLTGKR